MHDTMNSYGFYVLIAPFVLLALYMLVAGDGSK